MIKSISVVLATRNRSGALAATLAAMSRVRRGSLNVEFVVVDNGSVDGTARVLREASASLPLNPLWEPRPGKSHGLNAGLDRVKLGELVVFTDDDVTPGDDWFEEIVASCARWPAHAVFGGRVLPTWPGGQLPAAWAHDDFIQSFAFARHVISDVEGLYPDGWNPFGPNYWVRREAIGAARFMNGIGPHPTKRKLGGETEFLLRLRKRGHTPVFVPRSWVEHRIESARLSKLAIYRRAVQLGRGFVYTEGLPDKIDLQRSTAQWQHERARRLVRSLLRLPARALTLDENRRVVGIAKELVEMGRETEALLSWRRIVASAPADTTVTPQAASGPATTEQSRNHLGAAALLR
jgi:glycosyltransferase involved in cell wall biosynthesis